MKKVLLIVLALYCAWFVYAQYTKRTDVQEYERDTGNGSVHDAAMDREIQIAVDRSLAKAQTGDHQGATALLHEARERYPHNKQLYYYSGLIRAEQGDFAAAIEHFGQAIRLDPDFAEAYFSRGRAHASRGDYRDAVLDCSIAIELNPEDPRAYYFSALAKTGLDHHQDASDDLSAALEIDPRFADAWYARGFLRIHALDDTDGGCDDLKTAGELGRDVGDLIRDMCE